MFKLCPVCGGSRVKLLYISTWGSGFVASSSAVNTCHLECSRLSSIIHSFLKQWLLKAALPHDVTLNSTPSEGSIVLNLKCRPSKSCPRIKNLTCESVWSQQIHRTKSVFYWIWAVSENLISSIWDDKQIKLSGKTNVWQDIISFIWWLNADLSIVIYN